MSRVGLAIVAAAALLLPLLAGAPARALCGAGLSIFGQAEEGSGLGGTGRSGEGSGVGGTGRSGEGSGVGGTGQSGEGSGLGGTGQSDEGSGLGGTGAAPPRGTDPLAATAPEASEPARAGVLGVVTQVSPVCVGGIELRLGADSRVSRDGADATAESLQVGQAVWALGLSAPGEDGLALAVSSLEILVVARGTAEADPGDAMLLQVDGVRVRLAPGAVLVDETGAPVPAVTPGSAVEISGIAHPDGGWLATRVVHRDALSPRGERAAFDVGERIVRDRPAQVTLEGLVERGRAEGALRVAGLEVSAPDRPETLRAGERVRVRARVDAAGVVRATGIERPSRPQRPLEPAPATPRPSAPDASSPGASARPPAPSASATPDVQRPPSSSLGASPRPLLDPPPRTERPPRPGTDARLVRPVRPDTFVRPPQPPARPPKVERPERPVRPDVQRPEPRPDVQRIDRPLQPVRISR